MEGCSWSNSKWEEQKIILDGNEMEPKLCRECWRREKEKEKWSFMKEDCEK